MSELAIGRSRIVKSTLPIRDRIAIGKIYPGPDSERILALSDPDRIDIDRFFPGKSVSK